MSSTALQSAASATPNLPIVRSVTFSGSPGNLTLDIKGRNFGQPMQALPFSGTASNFRIVDQGALDHAGAGEWGFTGDTNILQFTSWTAGDIRVSGVAAAAGDALVIEVQNAATGGAGTWGGNVPPVALAPVITGVHFSSLRSGSQPSYLRIVVTGHGFGAAPSALASGPFTGDLDNFSLWDGQVQCNGPTALTAGGSYFGAATPDAVTLKFQSWSDTKIVIAGLGGAYGTGCLALHEGDAVAVTVWSSTATSLTGPQTARRAYVLSPTLRVPAG